MTRGFRLSAASGLHKGGREQQQDQVLVMSHPRVPGCVLGVVADGMGGRSGGRNASDQVLMTARQLFARYAPGRDDAPELLRRIALDAHTVIRLTAIATEEEPHSTLAAFLMQPRGECAWIHAGDSRIHLFRHGRLVARTRDHSYVQALIDRGEITESQALVHPRNNVLLGCLGMSTPPPGTVRSLGALQPHDALLACSDGLWHYLAPEEMGALIAKKTPREAARLLIDEALRRSGGKGDNLSLAILKLDPLKE